MRKFSLLLPVVLVLLPLLSAQAYQAECMVPGGKFVGCDVAFLENDLAIHYPQEQNQKLDQVIPGEKIHQISTGRSDQQSAERSMLLGLLNFFTMFDRGPKAQEMVGIDYLDANDKLKYILIRLKAADTYTFGTSLKKISGQGY